MQIQQQKSPQDIVREQLAALRSKHPNRDIVKITAWGNNGPTRVLLNTECESESGEKHQREVAVQDIFQVRLCTECKAKADKSKRKNRAGQRIASLKAELEKAQEEILALKGQQS